MFNVPFLLKNLVDLRLILLYFLLKSDFGLLYAVCDFKKLTCMLSTLSKICCLPDYFPQFMNAYVAIMMCCFPNYLNILNTFPN